MWTQGEHAQKLYIDSNLSYSKHYSYIQFTYSILYVTLGL